ncbi:MAG TPA: hypothetical protein VJ783_08720 [Pirellulales bacterium]|nr:hypothetical protein [Pirellulales bacterium]
MGDPTRRCHLRRKKPMSPAEQKVLAIFRMYRVSPYQMLCLNRVTQGNLEAPLQRLIQRGLVVKERTKDAYHLTPAGYVAAQSETESPVAS